MRSPGQGRRWSCQMMIFWRLSWLHNLTTTTRSCRPWNPAVIMAFGSLAKKTKHLKKWKRKQTIRRFRKLGNDFYSPNRNALQLLQRAKISSNSKNKMRLWLNCLVALGLNSHKKKYKIFRQNGRNPVSRWRRCMVNSYLATPWFGPGIPETSEPSTIRPALGPDNKSFGTAPRWQQVVSTRSAMAAAAQVVFVTVKVLVWEVWAANYFIVYFLVYSSAHLRWFPSRNPVQKFKFGWCKESKCLACSVCLYHVIIFVGFWFWKLGLGNFPPASQWMGICGK